MSETYTGSYAPELFNEDKRYYLLQAQQMTNLTDAELRDLHHISNTFNRRFIQTEIGNSAIDAAFKIVQDPVDNTNNFQITGGDGTTPAVLYLDGYRLYLNGDISYKDQTSTGSITRDGYTATKLPALTAPVGPISAVTGLHLNDSTLVLTNLGISSPVFTSNNCGSSWTSSTLPVVGKAFYSVSFFDALNGFVAGSNKTILKTINGGGTWSNSFGPGSGSLLDCAFITNFGWAVGQSGTILQYNALNSPQWEPVTSPTSSDLSGVAIVIQQIAWAVGASGIIVDTTDGVNWGLQTSPVTTNLARVSAIDANTVYAVGDNGVVLKTINGGHNWGLSNSHTSVNLHGLYFASSTVGWAVGSNGVIIHTTNGNTWDATTIASGIDLNSVIFKDTTGFVAGTGGAIYRTLDGINWEPYRTDYVYIDFHLGEVSAGTNSEYYDSTLFDTVVDSTTANRLRIVSDVKVSEGFPNPSNYSLDGTVQHLTLNIAKILRSVDQSSILSSMITDTRTVVRTIAEINNLFSSGGVDTSAIANGAITPAKIDPTGDYTVGALSVANDVLIQGELTVDGEVLVDNTNTTLNNLIVKGNTQLGDSTSPYAETVIFGNVQQTHDASTFSAYSLTIDSSNSTAAGFDIFSQGKGNVFEVWAISHAPDATNSIFKSLNLGNGYDFQLDHLGAGGGALNILDSGSQDSIVVTKNSSINLGSVFNAQSNSVSPLFNLYNLSSTDSTTINIDQTAGTMVHLNTNFDANGIVIVSQGSGTDLNIDHDGSYGTPVVIRNNSSQGAVTIVNDPYLDGSSAVSIFQYGNDTALSVNKDGTGLGRGLEVFNWGQDVGLGVYNAGSGVGQIISHVGDKVVVGQDTTNAGLFIYIAGTECGPGLLINKSNDNTGEVVRLWNQGFSESLIINHDRTDSSATMIRLNNQTPAGNYDISSNYWWIDNRGNFFTLGDVSTSLVAFDTTHYISAESIWLDSSNFDSSNSGIAGQAFIDSGFLRISDGSSVLPPIAGATGVAGPAGSVGPAGLMGATGIAGTPGADGVTGVSGSPGIAGTTGVAGVMGLQGVTGISGFQGVTGPGGLGFTGLRGPTGLQGITGPANGPQGATGVSGDSGATGIQGLIGPAGLDGNQGVTGVGIQGAIGSTGLQGIAGSQGLTGIQGMTGTGASVADLIPLGLPTDGTFQPGVFPFVPSTITTDAIDEINGLLLAIAPTPPNPLAGNLIYSGPTKYSAILPTGLSASLWYQNGKVAGSTISDYVVGNVYTLANPSGTFKCGSTFGGDVGTLAHIDDGTSTNSRLLNAGTGTTGDLQISSISVYNTIWHIATAQINYTQSNPGFRSHSLLYTVGASNQQTNNTYFWYDNNNLRPTFPTPLTVTPNTLSSSRYLSGIQYYSIGDSFNFNAVIGNLANQSIRPLNPLSYSMPGLNNVDIAINGALFVYNQSYFLNPIVALNAINNYSSNAVGIVTGRKPNGDTSSNTSVPTNYLVNTYSSTYSTNGNITMFDENYRFPLTTDFSVIPGSITGNWSSATALTNGNAQLYNSVWTYPAVNFTSSYYPAQGMGTNYSSFSGDQTIVWGVNVGMGCSNVQIVFTGMNYTSISPDHSGNLNLDVRLPSATGWLDGGRAFGSFYGDSTGCQLGSSSGNTLQLTFGTSSTSYSSGVVFIRVVLKNSSAAQASQMVVTSF